MPPNTASGTPEAREARDVMAFGQEIGRVLSDGRIVGRAEPFAKVFPSSRLVKKSIGLAAWGVLEDIALDGALDGQGRLVAETNVRRIADNLGLNKDTVTKHLRRLREYGFVLQEEARDDGSGRYDTCRYVLDPSACVEQFTHTPSKRDSARIEPCPKTSDTVPAVPVSEEAGHGDTGHGGFGHLQRDVVVAFQEEQQQTAREVDPQLRERLLDLGVAGPVAEQRQARERDERRAEDAAAAAEAELLAREQQHRADGWAAAVSAALDDDGLAEALARTTTPAPGLGRRSAPLARAQLLTWAVAVHRRSPQQPLEPALAAALAAGAEPVPDATEALPPPPGPYTRRSPPIGARPRLPRP